MIDSLRRVCKAVQKPGVYIGFYRREYCRLNGKDILKFRVEYDLREEGRENLKGGIMWIDGVRGLIHCEYYLTLAQCQCAAECLTELYNKYGPLHKENLLSVIGQDQLDPMWNAIATDAAELLNHAMFDIKEHLNTLRAQGRCLGELRAVADTSRVLRFSHHLRDAFFQRTLHWQEMRKVKEEADAPRELDRFQVFFAHPDHTAVGKALLCLLRPFA